MTYAHVIMCNDAVMGVVLSANPDEEVATPVMEQLMVEDYKRWTWNSSIETNSVQYLSRFYWRVRTFKGETV